MLQRKKNKSSILIVSKLHSFLWDVEELTFLITFSKNAVHTDYLHDIRKANIKVVDIDHEKSFQMQIIINRAMRRI